MVRGGEEEESSSLKLVEDVTTGALKLVNKGGAKSKGKRSREGEDGGAGGAIRRGVIRFLVIVVDASAAMNNRDMRPTRLGVVCSVVTRLLNDFFDQNPISQVALVLLSDGQAERITDLSGNVRNHKTRFEERMAQGNSGGKGAASLRYGLEEALRLLEVQASYGTREVLVLYGSLNTIDRGNIYDTVDNLTKGGIKVNIVGIGAEVFVCHNVCEETRGSYKVATTAQHLERFVLAHTKPAAVLDQNPDGSKVVHKPAAGMWVGFPEKRQQPLAGWRCPRCSSLQPDLPIDCSLCGLKLLSSSHLARSYHHLFPVPHFEEEEEQEDGGEGGAGAGGEGGKAREGWTCYGCGVEGLGSGGGMHRCQRCSEAFCNVCDGFVHETLHVCPGCSLYQQGDATQE